MRLIDLVNDMTVYLYGNDIEKWEKICKDAKEGKIPTITLRGIEYALVRHGYWTRDYESSWGDSRFMCSVCHCKESVPTCNGEPTIWDYCPNCGCKMDLDEVNDEVN